MFATHVVPATLVSDNGINFTSSEFQKLMRKNGTKHIKVEPYHPALNGSAQKAVRIFKEGYEKMDGGSVQTESSPFILSYRATPHSKTGVPPAGFLIKRRFQTQLNQLVQSVANRVSNKQSQKEAAHDYRAKKRDILEGQAV